jgi:hypothetical protein
MSSASVEVYLKGQWRQEPSLKETGGVTYPENVCCGVRGGRANAPNNLRG